MAYLFFQTGIWLLLAALFGFFIGWLIWGRRDSAVGKADAPMPERVEEPEFQEPDVGERMETGLEPGLPDRPLTTVTTEPRPGGEQATVPGIGSQDEQDIGRPALLDRPDGEPDDLKRIRGVGPVLERTLNNLGIYHFRQIADLTPANVTWVNAYLSFSGRIEREDWIGQARRLAGEETRDFSRGDEEEF